MDNKGLRITLDRLPRNTMDLVTARGAARGDEDSRVRAVLITGSGSAFGTGATSESAPPPGALPLLLKDLTTYLHAAVSRVFLSRDGDRRDPRTSGAAHRAPIKRASVPRRAPGRRAD